MRHESPSTFQRTEGLEIAAVWPSGPQIAPIPIPDLDHPRAAFQPTPAAPDVPGAVGGMIAAAYGFVILALFAATAQSAHSVFMIVIAALFVLIFFTVPRIFFRIEPEVMKRADLDDFLRNGIKTLTGHCSGRDALIQMLIVPVFLTLGIAAMGIAAAQYL